MGAYIHGRNQAVSVPRSVDSAAAVSTSYAHENEDSMISAAAYTLIILGTLSVIIRYVSRRYSGSHLGADDFLILPAWLFAMGTAICCLLSTRYGSGRHYTTLKFEQKLGLFETFCALEYMWVTALMFTKFSVLMFYRRLFGTSRAFWVCLTLVLVNWATFVISWASACTPTSFGWIVRIDPSLEPNGHCMDTKAFLLSTGLINLLLDMVVVLFPVPIVWKLQISTSQKLGVLGIFFLGGFVCITTAVRLVFAHEAVSSKDLSLTLGKFFIWSCVEPFVGIITACLPIIAPIIRIYIINRRKPTTLSWGDGTIRTNSRFGTKRGYIKGDSGHEDEIELSGRRMGSNGSGDEETEVGICKPRIVVQREVTVKWTEVENSQRHSPVLEQGPYKPARFSGNVQPECISRIVEEDEPN